MIRRAISFVLTASAVMLSAAAAAHADEPTLHMGDRAPKITVKRFLKGAPVTEFQKGKVYVVEFWATWCGPCRMTIPHLTALQKKYPSVTILGVSIFERDQREVEPFVQEMGDKMDYVVAMDAVPEDKDADEGAMATNWMTASGRQTIPTAFLVDREGKIAWFGFAPEVDQPLAAVLAGKWDTRTAAAHAAHEEELGRQLSEVSANGDRKEKLRILNEGLHRYSDMEQQLAGARFQLLVEFKALSSAQLLTLGKHLVDDVYRDDARTLDDIAWSLVNPGRDAPPTPALLALAVHAVQQADIVAKKADSSVADTLARAYFLGHQYAKAVEAEERSIRLAAGHVDALDPGPKERLAQYKKALAGGK